MATASCFFFFVFVFMITECLYRRRVAREIIKYSSSSRTGQFSSDQIFNATRSLSLSHTEVAPSSWSVVVPLRVGYTMVQRRESIGCITW